MGNGALVRRVFYECFLRLGEVSFHEKFALYFRDFSRVVGHDFGNLCIGVLYLDFVFSEYGDSGKSALSEGSSTQVCGREGFSFPEIICGCICGDEGIALEVF